MNQKLFDYIAASPTAFHAVQHTASRLAQAGTKAAAAQSGSQS